MSWVDDMSSANRRRFPGQLPIYPMRWCSDQEKDLEKVSHYCHLRMVQKKIPSNLIKKLGIDALDSTLKALKINHYHLPIINLYNRSGSPNGNKVSHIHVQYLKINEQENYYEGMKHSIFIWEYHTSKISDLSIVLTILIFYKIFCFCIYIHNGLYIK